MAGIEMDRVETLLRERSAEMTRTRDAAKVHLSLDGSTLDVAPEPDPAPVLEVTHEGACVDCGDRISSARLKALPDAVRCVGCQRQLETQTR
ncbi:MAG TPA: TraR/DksA C4-type zinc finger protein [Thermoleophilaceae bacterium]